MPIVPHPIPITPGSKFGRWTVIGERQKRKGYRGFPYVLCRCECGTERVVFISGLQRGKTLSCGCFSVDAAKSRITHGQSRTGQRSRLHSIWISMKSRCSNPKTGQYDNYGGRGVRVCQEWQTSFVAFHNWAVTNGYQDSLSIERRDVNGNYEPSNCSWATQTEQARNKTDNKIVTAFGETKCVAEWSEDPRCQVSRDELYCRLNRLKWPAEDAISRPTMPIGQKRMGVTAFGETKSITEWAADSRCLVSIDGLSNRLAKGVPPEVAITSPHQKGTKFL